MYELASLWDKKEFCFSQKITNETYKSDNDFFSVKIKPYYELEYTRELIEVVMPKLCYLSDGLIFQGKNDPYSPGTFRCLLKWKFERLNSVDVLLISDLKTQAKYKIFAMSKRGKLEHIDNDVLFPDNDQHITLNRCIIECTYDKNLQKLLLIKKRLDKTTPNGINVYKGIMKSIKDNVSCEELLENIEKEK
jgi:mRNA-capping enzyme